MLCIRCNLDFPKPLVSRTRVPSIIWRDRGCTCLHGIIWHKSITSNLLCIVRALSQKQFFFLFFSHQRNSIRCKLLSRKVLPLCSTTSPFWSHFPASLLPSWQPGRVTHGSPWLHFVTEVRICQTVRLHRFDSQTYLNLDARSFKTQIFPRWCYEMCDRKRTLTLDITWSKSFVFYWERG